MIRVLIATLFCLTSAAHAEEVRFDDSWQTQGVLWFRQNAYALKGDVLGVSSSDSFSFAWTPRDQSLANPAKASWEWAVAESVPATDLRNKGGEDRNLAIYFVYLSPNEAARFASGPPRRIISMTTYVLSYVWGGSQSRGTTFRSPYSETAEMFVLRPSGTGRFRERVDLASDLKQAFGSKALKLSAIMVLADSDDTGADVRAEIRNLRLE